MNESSSGNLVIADFANKSKLIRNITYSCLIGPDCNITLDSPLSIKSTKNYFIYLVSSSAINMSGNYSSSTIFHYNNSEWIDCGNVLPYYKMIHSKQAGNIKIWLGYNYSSGFKKIFSYDGTNEFSSIVSGFGFEIMDYLDNCQQDPCPVPMIIESEYPGRVSIFNFTVNYTGPVSGIKYYISNDGGSNWTRVYKDTPAYLPKYHDELKVKVELWRNNIYVVTPRVSVINLYSQPVSWEPCVGTKPWTLDVGGGDGKKTVFYQIRDIVGNIVTLNDTITYSSTGKGLDTTPPTAPVVIDDGRWTKYNTTLHAMWVNASDRQNELLMLPLRYRFRIFDNSSGTVAYSWTETEKTEVTVQDLNLSNGHRYIFEVRTINSADLESETAKSNGITVDVVAPKVNITSVTHDHISLKTKYSTFTNWDNDTTAYFNWSGNDAVSGILAYSYLLNAINDTDSDEIPEGSVPYDEERAVEYYNLTDGEYYLHIRAVDNALNWGQAYHYQIKIDHMDGAPKITFVKPRGLTIDVTPELYVKTNEYARCKYQINDTTDGRVWDYVLFPTDEDVFTRTHVARLSLTDNHDYRIDFNCSDVVGHYNDTTYTTFMVNSSGTPSSVNIIDYRAWCVAGHLMKAQVNVTFTSGVFTYGLEGLGDNLYISVNSSLVDPEIFDSGDGIYNVTFRCPIIKNNYTLNASVNNIYDEVNFEVVAFAVTVGYQTALTPVSESNLIYIRQPQEYTLGIASDTNITIPGGLSMTKPNAAKGNIFLFVTSPYAAVDARSSYLRDGSFVNLMYPSFGLPLEKESQNIGTILEYDDIVFEGDVNTLISDGQYTLVLQRKANKEGKKVILIKII